MKKALFLSLALILLLGITSHGTSSYFSDTETSSGNTFTAWVEECVCYKFNVSNNKGNPDNIFTYDASGNLVDSFDLSASNTSSQGVASTDDYIYVIDLADKQAYRYTCCGSPAGVSRELLPSAGNSIANPVGLAIDGNEMWVVSANDKKIYGYSLSAAYPYSDTPLTPTTEIPLVPNNTGATGLAIDGTYLYVLDYENSSKETRLYRYLRTDGSVTVSKVLLEKNTTTNNKLQSPAGAMFYGTSLWVVDRGTNKMYEYDVTELFNGSGTLNAKSEFPLDSANNKATGV